MREDNTKRPTLIAHVVCGEFPGGTLADFLMWRAAEDTRMAKELAEQREAWLQLRAGATRH